MFKIIDGNLLDATEQFVAHQCNCLSRGQAAGIAKHIFSKWPWADVYIQRNGWVDREISKPGTVQICGNGKDQRYVVALYSQIYPGQAYPPKDSAENRQKLFRESLDCFKKFPEVKGSYSIAFPWKVGCGIAGGDWTIYQAMLEEFSKDVDGDVVIYKPEWEQ